MASLWLPNGPVTQEFGCTGFASEPAYGGCPHFHMGVDYAVPTGTPVLAPGVGRVIQAGWNNGYGNSVTVDLGNGLTVLQGHLSSILAKVGDLVTAGQGLGLSGSTGNSTGPHIHFEAKRNGTPVDPRTLEGAAAGPSGASGVPIIGGIVDAANGAGAIMDALNGFAGALLEPGTWTRIALIIGGIGLIVSGAWYMMSVPDDGE